MPTAGPGHPSMAAVAAAAGRRRRHAREAAATVTANDPAPQLLASPPSCRAPVPVGCSRPVMGLAHPPLMTLPPTRQASCEGTGVSHAVTGRGPCANSGPGQRPSAVLQLQTQLHLVPLTTRRPRAPGCAPCSDGTPARSSGLLPLRDDRDRHLLSLPEQLQCTTVPILPCSRCFTPRSGS